MANTTPQSQRPSFTSTAPKVNAPKPSITILSTFGLFALVAGAVLTLYRSKTNAFMLSFIFFAFVDLAALYFCLRRYEKLGAGDPGRGRLRIAIWTLSTALNFAFAWRVAAAMPAPLKAVVWAVAVAVAGGGFYGFFVKEEEKVVAVEGGERTKKRRGKRSD